MKKVRFILFAAVAGLLAVSCTKEVNREVLPDETNSPIHFRAIANAVDTRTAVLSDESFIKWLETDQLKIVETLTYTLDGEEKTVNNSGSAVVASLSDSDKKAVFDATVTAGLPSGATLKSATYVAAYPAVIHSGDEEQENLKQGGSGDAKFWRVNMPATQHPEVGSFDPDADILLSGPASKDDNSRVAEGDDLGFSFHRIGTAVKMTVKGLASGEKLQKIVITAPVQVAGYVKVDLANGDYLDGTLPYSNGSNVLTLKFDDLAISGNLDVWFRVLAVDWSGTLEISAETDKADYYRTSAQETAITLSSPMVFADGGLTKFAVNLGVKRVAKQAGTVYTKVTSSDEIGEGANYIVAYLANAEATTATVMGPIASGNSFAGYVQDIAVSNNAITIQNQAIQVVTFEEAENEGEYYVKFGDKYLYLTSAANNKLALSDAKLSGSDAGKDVWSVTPSGITSTVMKNSSNVYFEIRFNSNSGQERFSSYPGTQKAITLFKNGDVHVVPAIIPSTASLSVGYQGLTDADDLSFSLKNLEGTIEVTCDGTVVTEAVDVDNTIVYSVSANTGDARTGWIEIAVGDVSARVTVSQLAAPSIDFETIAELNTLAASLSNNGSADYTGKLTNAVVSFVPDSGNAIVKDATGSILVFKSSHGLLQGQTFSGELNVTVKMYYTTIEITAIDAVFSGSQTEVLPANVTLSQLVGNFTTYQNAYVKVDNLTVTEKNGKNITVSNGDKTYVVYDNAGASVAETGDIISVVGTVADHNGVNQIKAWASNDITVTTSAPKAITFTQPTEANCSITVSAGGSSIASGATVATGTVVTLSATVGTGFTFGGWTVSGAEVANASATTTTFTMGTSAVSIRASFVNASGTKYTKVTSAPSDWSGTYIIVYESTATSGLVCLAGTDAYQNFTTATISSGVITSNDLSDYEVEIAGYSTGYSVKALGGANAGKYLEGKGSSSNGTAFAASPSNVTTLDLSDGVVTITNNTNLFVYNSTSGTNGERWRFYKSGTASGDAYKKPALYKKN